jgi:hypothetical protein
MSWLGVARGQAQAVEVMVAASLIPALRPEEMAATPIPGQPRPLDATGILTPAATPDPATMATAAAAIMEQLPAAQAITAATRPGAMAVTAMADLMGVGASMRLRSADRKATSTQAAFIVVGKVQGPE